MKNKPNPPVGEKKGKGEFRYQFLGYDEVGTGKYMSSPIYSLGIALGSTIMHGDTVEHNMIEIKKTVAMVFDKQTGEVKQTEIKKL
jgi:hypothetical protein